MGSRGREDVGLDRAVAAPSVNRATLIAECYVSSLTGEVGPRRPAFPKVAAQLTRPTSTPEARDAALATVLSREDFIAVLTRFAPKATGLMAIISEFAVDDQVLMLYDLPISPIGPVRCCDHVVIADGKIRANKLLFGMAPFQHAAQAATAARPGQ